MLIHHKISVQSTKKKVVAPPATDFIVCLDCSGSMSYELPKLKTQLKNKIATLLKPEDTLTLIWFSGRNEAGIILEAEPVASLSDLSRVHSAIDRFLRPVGMTGFVDPLRLASEVIGRLAGSKNVPALYFLTDGFANTSSEADILAALKKVPALSTTFVEYGYYANRALLAKMAEISGGTHIFSEDFRSYEPVFEAAMTRKSMGAKKIEVSVQGNPVLGLVYALVDGQVMSFAVENKKALVPDGIPEVYYATQTTAAFNVEDASTVYALMGLAAARMASDLVFDCLKQLGDVSFINEFAGCFGKQRYSAFIERAMRAAFDPKLRLTEGYDTNAVPPEDAFTVLELLSLLNQYKCTLLVDHPDFKYNRTGRAAVTVSGFDKHSEELKALATELAKASSLEEAQQIQAKISSLIPLMEEKALVMTYDPIPDGIPITNLVWNQERPNISVQTVRTGTVDLSSVIGKDVTVPTETPEVPFSVPLQFPTHVTRNYTVVKDGLINLTHLPIKMSQTAAKNIRALLPKGTFTESADNESVILTVQLDKIPVINRMMVKSAEAKKFFTLELSLLKAKGAQKVWGSVLEEVKGTKVKDSKGLLDTYGETATAWLKELGITDNGFAPKTVLAAPTDVYLSKELNFKAKGCSSLPKVSDVVTKVASGKPTPVMAFMTPALKEWEAFKATKASPEDTVTFVEGKLRAAQTEARELGKLAAQVIFVVIVGQVWFQEFASLDENSMEVEFEGNKYLCTAELKEAEVKI